jgi:hypothetical protein
MKSIAMLGYYVAWLLSAAFLLLVLLGYARAEVTCRPDTYGRAVRCNDGTTWKADRYDYGKTVRSNTGIVCTKGTYNSTVRCKSN